MSSLLQQGETSPESIRVHTGARDPHELTTRLGVAPTTVHRAGEPL